VSVTLFFKTSLYESKCYMPFSKKALKLIGSYDLLSHEHVRHECNNLHPPYEERGIKNLCYTQKQNILV